MAHSLSWDSCFVESKQVHELKDESLLSRHYLVSRDNLDLGLVWFIEWVFH